MDKIFHILEQINEIVQKKKWIAKRTAELNREELQKLWDMYKNTYAKLGFNASSSEHFQQKYKILWFIDIDTDPLPEAFLTYRESPPHGNKITALGSDGQKISKSLLIKKLISLVKSKGWFIEASHRVAEILSGSGVPVVKDEKKVRDVLMNTTGMQIEWLGNGEYKRKLRGTSIMMHEKLFGNPK